MAYLIFSKEKQFLVPFALYLITQNQEYTKFRNTNLDSIKLRRISKKNNRNPEKSIVLKFKDGEN